MLNNNLLQKEHLFREKNYGKDFCQNCNEFKRLE